MLPNTFDPHEARRVPLDAAEPDCDDPDPLDHEMIRWLPLIAANDFLETHSQRDPPRS